MADVFLARRRGAAGIAKRLVVKRMRSDLNSDPRLAELFLREARVATQLSHKNIVTVFDVGRDPDGLFLAMEYVDGPDLAAAIHGAREHGVALDPLLAAHIASEVAAGLDHAHRLRDERGALLGVVHRDVTPRNILLSLDGEVKVTDFGVAVLHGDAAVERRGTVPYMSPEQARGEPVDARADLFSLGLVLHELLSGSRAYPGPERDDMLAQARAGQVPALDGDVPAELARMVARATAVDPDARFAGVRELQRELAGWAVGERGRRGQTDPLEHALASFLARAVPGWADRSDQATDGRSAGVAGTATLQSVAETVGDERSPAPPEPPEPVEETESIARRRRPALLLAGAALAAIAAAALFATTRGDAEPATPTTTPPPGPPSSLSPAVVDPPPADQTPAARLDPSVEPAPSIAAAPAPTPSPSLAPPSLAPARSPDRARVPTAASPHASTARRTPRDLTAPRAPVTGPAPAVAGTGTLDFNAVPWAYVSIDGRPEEETPIRARTLTVGRHRVRVRNPVLERQREVEIEIAPGETTRYVVDLRQ